MIDVVCSMHQLNFLPGASVIHRLRRADIVVWLDKAQYVHKSFVNRNRFDNGGWMTVPVNEHDHFAAINRVRIADEKGRARAKIAKTIEYKMGEAGKPYADEIRKPYTLLAGLNHALILRLFSDLGIDVEHRFQSLLDYEPTVPVVTEDGHQVSLVRDRYADMAEQVGANVYLSGPAAHHGDAASFADRGIRIEYTDEWRTPNPCGLECLDTKQFKRCGCRHGCPCTSCPECAVKLRSAA